MPNEIQTEAPAKAASIAEMLRENTPDIDCTMTRTIRTYNLAIENRLTANRNRLVMLGLFGLLAVVHSWPLAGDLAHLSRLDNDDAALNTWIIAWTAHILPLAPWRLFEAPIFYPELHTLAYSEHMFVPSVMGAPLLWAGAGPVLVHNLLFLAGLGASGFAMCLVMTRWTGSRSAGVIAGLLYGFNAHVLMRFPHLQAQHAEFFPIMLYAMDRVLTRNAPRDRWLLAATFALQSLCSNYFLVFSTFALVIAAAVRWNEWLPRNRRPTLASLGLAGVAGTLAVAPLLWPYYQVRTGQGLVRSLDEVARYSARWQDYLATGARVHEWWSHPFVNGNAALFPGVIGVVLAAVAVGSGLAWRDPRARMATAFGVVGVCFSFGPAFPGYAFLHTHLPLLTSMRAAARWGWLGLVAVAILGGFGAAVIERQGWLARWRRPVMVLLALLVTAEALRAPVGFTYFPGVPAIYDRLAATSPLVLAEFPFYSGPRANGNGPYVLNNTRYFAPLVNGYSGFEPDTYVERARHLETFPETEAITVLRALGVTHVTVHVAAFAQRSGAEALESVGLRPELHLLAEDGGIRLYQVR